MKNVTRIIHYFFPRNLTTCARTTKISYTETCRTWLRQEPVRTSKIFGIFGMNNGKSKHDLSRISYPYS